MPYTPAISLFMMLHQRLKDIADVGVDTLVTEQSALANYFRSEVRKLPFKVFSEVSSNALTALWCDEGINAFEVVRVLQEKYNIYVASNGGELRDRVFRVSHMGCQSQKDLDFLIGALEKTVLEMDAHERNGGLDL